jgi:hypothetical protein
VHRVELYDVKGNEVRPPLVEKDQKFVGNPTAIQENDNTDGNNAVTNFFAFEGTVFTSETTTLETTKSQDYEVGASDGVSFGIVTAEASFTAGASFSLSKGQSKTKEFTSTETRTYEITAGPGEITTATVYFKTVSYEYEWDSPVRTFYAGATLIGVDGGSFSGTIGGEQAFPKNTVKYVTTPPKTDPCRTRAEGVFDRQCGGK